MTCLSVVALQVVEQDDPTLQRLKSDLAAAKCISAWLTVQQLFPDTVLDNWD